MDQPPAAPAADDPLSSILLIVACLILSFLFAGSETAITSMGEPRVRRLLDEGKGPKRFLETWLDDHTSILTSLLAGNTLVNIFASALVTSLTMQLASANEAWSEWSDTLMSASVFGLTMVVLVIGEIAPKTLAKSHPTWFLRPFWLIWLFHVPTTRLTRGLSWVAKQLIRVLGVDTDASGFVVTEEQIEDMVRIGSEEGSIDVSRGDLLQNVFDLWDISVYQIMTPRTQVEGLPADASHADVLETVRRTAFSRFPVYGESADEVLGVFYAKTLIETDIDPEVFKITDHLAETMFVPESQKAGALLKEFQTRAVHMAVVVDEHGGTAGVVSLEDVLEELVGEIYDEHDEVERWVEPTGPNSWIIDGAAELRTVEEEIAVELPEETPYSTVGGFVVDQLGKLPKATDSFTWECLQVTVLEADDKKVLRVEFLKLPEAEALAKAG